MRGNLLTGATLSLPIYLRLSIIHNPTPITRSNDVYDNTTIDFILQILQTLIFLEASLDLHNHLSSSSITIANEFVFLFHTNLPRSSGILSVICVFQESPKSPRNLESHESPRDGSNKLHSKVTRREEEDPQEMRRKGELPSNQGENPLFTTSSDAYSQDRN